MKPLLKLNGYELEIHRMSKVISFCCEQRCVEMMHSVIKRSAFEIQNAFEVATSEWFAGELFRCGLKPRPTRIIRKVNLFPREYHQSFI